MPVMSLQIGDATVDGVLRTLTPSSMLRRLRLSVHSGRANEVRVGVEILPIVAGLSMVQVGMQAITPYAVKVVQLSAYPRSAFKSVC